MLRRRHLVSRFIMFKQKLSFSIIEDKLTRIIYRIICKCIESKNVSGDKRNESNHDDIISENYRKFHLLEKPVRKNNNIVKIKISYKMDCII